MLIMSEQQQQTLHKQVHEIDEKLSRVLDLLTGNKYDRDDKGFIGVVNALEERVKILEKWRDRAIYVFIGMAFPSGIGVWKIINELVKV